MPRGRPRKPRLTRMDAAVDAMSQLGFQDRLVKKCVKQLLKEYGGDDAWPFIEEYAYRELIEAILRDNDENGQVRVREEGETSQDHTCLTLIRPEPENTSQENETPLETLNGEPERSREVACVNSFNSGPEAGCSKLFSSSSAEGDTTGWKDIVQDQTFVSTEQTDDVVCSNEKQPKATGLKDIVQDQTFFSTEQTDDVVCSNEKQPKATCLKDIVQDQTFVSTEQTNDVFCSNEKQPNATGLKDIVQDQTFVSTEQTDDVVCSNEKQPKAPEPADKTKRKIGENSNHIEAAHQDHIRQILSICPESENTHHGKETPSETSYREPENTQAVAVDDLSNSAAESDCSKLFSCSSGIITSEGETTGWKDIVQDQTSVSTEQTDDAGRINGKRPKSPEPAVNIVHKSGDDPNQIKAVHQANNPMIRSKSSSLSHIINKQRTKRHFPCYGWIDDYDDEDSPTDLVYSKPAVESDTSSFLPIAVKRRNKRHFPCYGWIENDDGCRIDFVYSKPAFGSFGPKPDDRRKDVLRSSLGGRKRKQSRWDLHP